MRRTIKSDNLPARCPWTSTMVVGLFLDRVHAPGWAWGAFIVVTLIAWIAWVCLLVDETHMDIFKDKV